MNEKNRNYRMFKKRYAEMDLYQEFRRSHERVKVMLSETFEEKHEMNSTPPSAQENLQRFIRQHESTSSVPELEPEPNTTTETETEIENSDQSFIDLANETIISERSDYYSPETNNYTFTNQESINLQETFLNENQKSSSAPSPRYESPYPDQENFNSNVQPSLNIGNSKTRKSNRVEDELDAIIREALNNVGPMTNISSSEIDPELLSMLKKLLIKKNISANERTNQFSLNFSDSNPQGEFVQNDVFSQIQKFPLNNEATPGNQLNFTENNPSRTKSSLLDEQVSNAIVPPKIPSNKSNVKRPETRDQVGVFDPAFSTIELDEDSSLALTKKEISMQVKNLIRESLEDNKQETTKTNDLLELEKQLKEHIEKIKQSRKDA